MLGKTANGLYWMYRYFERAENTSRLIETGQRIALTRTGGAEDEWNSVLKTVGVDKGFWATHDEISQDAAIDWMLRARENPSSVRSVIEAARSNARQVRTALTNDVWAAVNRCYMQTTETLSRKVSERDLPAVLGMIRQQTALVRGTTNGTMLRNDIYDFARIGTFLERADNTARILDVKYYVLLPSVMAVGSKIDNVQWETILQSVSARGGFRMEYGNTVSPKGITQFLILDKRMPRSLAFCIGKLCDNLDYLTANYGDSPPSHEKSKQIFKDYLSVGVEEIFEFGLHEHIQAVLGELGNLGRQIEIDYRFYE